MIGISVTSWLAICCLFIISYFAGKTVSVLLPWRKSVDGWLVSAASLILAPYLTGFSIILVLMLFPEFSQTFHILAVFILLSVIALLKLCTSKNSNLIWKFRFPYIGDFLLILLLLSWVVALFVNAVFLPLTQNDSLEYLTVGRVLNEYRTLDVYPVIQPDKHVSGFFGPWTHPPLYVSLIYLFSAIQGHIEEPGLVRLISPWFLLVSTLGVIALGGLKKGSSGLLAGLLFISTPLLFLGADSSLIDPLPVSAVVLILLAFIGFDNSSKYFALALGVVLALGLWTHSQAILFLPIVSGLLVILRGLKSFKRVTFEFFTILLISFVIAGWPYFKNYLIFGSPISDNPEVFAMAKLDWKGYFEYARGLDHWIAKVQYGVFKGWFSVEAYGYLFWLMTIGVIFVFKEKVYRGGGKSLFNGLDSNSSYDLLLLIAFWFLIIYISGIVFSVALGLDLMIRNERYLLILVPVCVIFASHFVIEYGGKAICFIKSPASSNWKKDTLLLISWFLLLVLLLQFIMVGWYYRWRNTPPKTDYVDGYSQELIHPSNRFEEILAYWSSIAVVKELENIVPHGDKVLSMRPADMYYSNRTMVSYLDPKMLPVYEEDNAYKVSMLLKRMGVKYVHMTDYFLPPVSNSSIQYMLADPSLSKLEFSKGMSQIYTLVDSGLSALEEEDLTPGLVPWTRTVQLNVGGRKALARVGLHSALVDDNQMFTSSFPAFHRDYSTITTLGIGSSLSWNHEGSDSFFEVAENNEHLIKLDLDGEGFIRIWIAQFDSIGNPIYTDSIEKNKPWRIGELSLSSKYPQQKFIRRVRFLPEAKYIRIGVEQLGKSRLKINKATITRLN